MKDSTGYFVTALELRNYCDGAIQFFRYDTPVEPELWLLLRNGDTVTIPGRDYANYEGDAEFPILLMTGPDPDWLVQWFMPDTTVGGDEYVAAKAQAVIDAKAATDEQWLTICQRAIDAQFAPSMPFNP